MTFKYLIFCCLLFSAYQSKAQGTSGIWTAFWDESYELRGFKNAAGEVMISPKFMGFTVAHQFEDVIAVMEENNGEFISYHLAKSGKIFGRDSLYISDNSADCESEGFIRFEANEKVGMFNSEAEIVIPADYNALSRVMNGFVIALKGARKSYWNKVKHSGCNHYSWKGGKTILLDTANNILIKDFEKEKQLDFYSVEIKQEKHPDPARLHFRAEDGRYYSFVEVEKAFRNWLFDDLLHDLTLEEMLKASNDSISFWDNESGWVNQHKSAYLTSNFEVIARKLLQLKNPSTEYFISLGDLIIYNENSKNYDQYFNNCNQSKHWQYPLFTIVISAGEEENFKQDHISFLKTNAGYQLINVTLRNP